jgi:hypothetical protein
MSQAPVFRRLKEGEEEVVRVCSEASAVVRAVAAYCSLTEGICRSRPIRVFGTHRGASTITRRALHWKRSRISMLDVEAAPHSSIPSPDRLEDG